MMDLLERAKISTAGQRGLHILWRLAQEGLLCFAAREGKQQTFALLEEWAPQPNRRPRDEALAGLARRYFSAHGPATLQDFVWWTGLKVSDAKAALNSVCSQLSQRVIDGVSYWMNRGLPVPPTAGSAVYLLPGFDEYLLGYRNRSAALEPRHSQKIIPGGNGMFLPTIVINGQVAGTWKRVLKKNEVVVTASPFAPLRKAEQNAVAAAAERYCRFAGPPNFSLDFRA